MKRWIWPAMAVAAAVGVVVWWLIPNSVDVAMITAIRADGTVEWVDAELRPAEENHSYVHELSGDRNVSKLADDVVIHTAFSCGTPTGGLELTWYGLGAAECSREEFLALEYPPYAPRLTFNGDGEITAITGRYHP